MTDDDGGGGSFWFLSGWVGGLACFEDQDEPASPLSPSRMAVAAFCTSPSHLRNMRRATSESRLAPIIAVRISTLSCSVASCWDMVVFWRPVISPLVVLSEVAVVPVIAKPGISFCNLTMIQALLSFAGRGYNYGLRSLKKFTGAPGPVLSCLSKFCSSSTI